MFRYVHTNIISKDANKLIDFYKKVLHCRSINEVRDLKGEWPFHASDSSKTKEEVALAGIDTMEDFMNECGIITSIKELGATEEMLSLIADSTIMI